MKQFTEDGRFDVIASGSLMGVKLSELKKQNNADNELVPMDYDELLQMFGLDSRSTCGRAEYRRRISNLSKIA